MKGKSTATPRPVANAARCVLLVMLAIFAGSFALCRREPGADFTRELARLAADPALQDSVALEHMARVIARAGSADLVESTAVRREGRLHALRITLVAELYRNDKALLRWAQLVSPESAYMALLVHRFGSLRNPGTLLLDRKVRLGDPPRAIDAPRPPAIAIFRFVVPPPTDAPASEIPNPFVYIPGQTQPAEYTAEGPRFTDEQMRVFLAVSKIERSMRVTGNHSGLLGISGPFNFRPPRGRLPDFRKRRGRIGGVR